MSRSESVTSARTTPARSSAEQQVEALRKAQVQRLREKAAVAKAARS